MNGIDFPVARGARRDRRRDRGRVWRRSRSTWSSAAGSTSRASCRWRAWARETGVILRFIEYMDVGHSNGWRLDEVVPADRAGRDDRRRSGRSSRPSRPTAARSPTAGATSTAAASSGSSRRSPSRSAATARGPGSRPRASSTRACSRSTGHDLRARPPLGGQRRGADAPSSSAIWLRRGDRYSELRSAATSTLPQDRDVRDGRLSAADRTFSTGCPQRSTSRGWRRRATRGLRG